MKTYIVTAKVKAYYHNPDRKVTHPVKAKDKREAESKFIGHYKLTMGSDNIRFENIQVFEEIE